MDTLNDSISFIWASINSLHIFPSNYRNNRILSNSWTPTQKACLLIAKTMIVNLQLMAIWPNNQATMLPTLHLHIHISVKISNIFQMGNTLQMGNMGKILKSLWFSKAQTTNVLFAGLQRDLYKGKRLGRLR